MRPVKNYTYLISDYAASTLAWLVFYFIRRQILYQHADMGDAVHLPIFWASLIGIPLFWIILFALAGSYQQNLYERSRLTELTQTFIWTLVGSIIIFFIFLIDDLSDNFILSYYYKGFFTLFICELVLVFAGRYIILSRTKQHLLQGRYSFNIVVAGNRKTAIGAVRDIERDAPANGWRIQGYLADGATTSATGNHLNRYNCLGELDDIDKVLATGKIDKLVIALEPDEKLKANALAGKAIEHDVEVLLVPDMQDIVSGSVRSSNITQGQFIVLDASPMKNWQQNLKRVIDVSFAIIGLLLLWPLFLYSAYRVSRSGPGGILYRQPRIGYKGKSFTIYKFRSMVDNAEPDGPALSYDNDPRITPWGRIMRKWRIDELPQLWNILKGDMSAVGPRPERPYFVEQIKQRNRYFKYLLRVKPGLTSWGMVQFGYASTIDEMLNRMKYDLLYVENASIALDLKIMLYTLRIIFLGKGK